MSAVDVARIVALAGLVASCGVVAPSHTDVGSLLARRGPVDAHRDLEIQSLANPRDVGARLAIAELDERIGKPAEAIDELDTVETLGGPLGTRWHDADRVRLGRLLIARAEARLARGAPSAFDDLQHARKLGATVPAVLLARARAAAALVDLMHVDAGVRARGRAALAVLDDADGADPSWRGAHANASPADHAAFGAWLWQHGARREAYEQLDAWHAATPTRDERLQTFYLRALGWWSPMWLGEAPLPPPADLVGPERCRFSNACDARTIVDDPDAARALLGAPIGPPTDDPTAASAFAVITLRGALHGEGAWGRAFVARVEVGKLHEDALAPPLRSFVARLAGRAPSRVTDGEIAAAPPGLRLVAAADRALAGESVQAVRAALGPLAEDDDGRALLAIAAPAVPYLGADPAAAAAARYAHARVAMHGDAGVPSEAALLAIARAFRRDPEIAVRLGRELVASAFDAALGHAAVGALFDAVGDPARSRVEWQAAYDDSHEPELAIGLALSVARTGDGDAALVDASTAAAASGDPGATWVAISHALFTGHRTVDALTAARSALDLAGPDALPDALDAAAVASRELGRAAQADALVAQRARLAPPTAHAIADPTDAAAAFEALRQTATASTIARAWVAARWNPREVELRAALLDAIARDDPRRAALIADLVALAGDPDPERGLAAALALHGKL